MEWDNRLSESISKGIENGLDKMGDKLADKIGDRIVIAVRTALYDAADIVLDGVSVLLTVALIYTGFKFMFIVDTEERVKNGNVLVCLFALYFIVRISMTLLS